jgi:hypothetical protein
MLYLNGNVWSRFDRLTFNGQSTAAVDVDQSWDGSTGYFDTGNEYADDVFENADTGFRCGYLNWLRRDLDAARPVLKRQCDRRCLMELQRPRYIYLVFAFPERWRRCW